MVWEYVTVRCHVSFAVGMGGMLEKLGVLGHFRMRL